MNRYLLLFFAALLPSLLIVMEGGPVYSQTPLNIQKIQDKIQQQNPLRLSPREKQKLYRHIRKQELSKLRTLLNQYADVNGDGSINPAEKQLISQAMNRARKDFTNIWTQMDSSLQRRTGQQGHSGKLVISKKGQKSRRKKRGQDRLEQALQKAQRALQKARKRAKQARKKGRKPNQKSSRNLDRFQQKFDQNQNGRLENQEKARMNKYLQNNPIVRYFRALRNEFIGRKEQLLQTQKNPGLQTNAINFFARSLRQTYLEKVLSLSNHALSDADTNGNNRIDQSEIKQLKRSIRQQFRQRRRKRRHRQRGRRPDEPTDNPHHGSPHDGPSDHKHDGPPHDTSGGGGPPGR